MQNIENNLRMCEMSLEYLEYIPVAKIFPTLVKFDAYFFLIWCE
jgi:hypothetical protein